MYKKDTCKKTSPTKTIVRFAVALLILIITVCIASVFLSFDSENSSHTTAETSFFETATFEEKTSAEEVSAQALAQSLQNFSAFQNSDISAPCAGLYEAHTFTPIYEKEAQKRIHPASLAKVLTAITALSYVPSHTVFTVGSEQDLVPARSSLCLIKKGQQLTLYQLLSGMLIASGNDAAYTVAVNTARFVMDRQGVSDREALSYFAALMNSVAKTAGAESSDFMTPDGFDSDGQYTTIRDLAIICRYALNFSEICEIVRCDNKYVVFQSGENVTWKNSNQLLNRESPYYYSKAIGMKTGTTPLAGKCLMAVAEIKGKSYISVVSGCNSEDSRYKSVTDLFDFASRM